MGPVVDKRGEGSVGKTTLEAVSNPTEEEPSGSSSNLRDSSGPHKGLIAIPTGSHQENQENQGSSQEGVEPVPPDGRTLRYPPWTLPAASICCTLQNDLILYYLNIRVKERPCSFSSRRIQSCRRHLVDEEDRILVHHI